ncbi:MAG: oligosaccharide flippase family protein [Clostridiaceae bacterium]
MKKQSLLKGTLILGMAGIISKFLGLFFRWPLIMMIGDEGMGYYQMAYPLFLFFIGVASGIPIAVSKLVSERDAVGDSEGAISVLHKALIFMFIIGGGFTAAMLIFARPIASFLKWDPNAYYSLLGISFAPIIIGFVSAFRGYFQGLQNMTPTAISEIVEQIARVIVGVGLAYLLLSRGIQYSAGGAAVGVSAGGIFGLAYLYKKYRKNRRELGIKKVRNSNYIMGKLLQVALPISIGSIITSMLGLLDSALVPQLLLMAGYTQRESTILLGQLSGKASVIVNVPLSLSFALCASIVPIIATAYFTNNRMELERKTQHAISISMSIAIPSMFGIFFMAQPILNLLFPGHAEGYTILKYMAVVIPFMILAQTTTAILQGSGHYFKPVVHIFIACIIKAAITVVLVPIPEINVNGAVTGSIVGYIFASILNTITLIKKLHVKIDFYKSIIKPAYASVAMVTVVVYLHSFLYIKFHKEIIATATSIFAGGMLYLFLIALLGIFDLDVIKEKLFGKRR